MRLCVGCTDFAYVCARIFKMHRALRRLYGLSRTFVYGFAQCMWLCVGCTAFAYVFVRLCTMYTGLHRLFGFLRMLVYGFIALIGLYVCIRLLCVKRLVRMDAYF